MRKVNLNNKTIREFTTNDTIYIAKMKSGFQTIYFCQFVKFEKGMVHATIISEDDMGYNRPESKKGQFISSRIVKCLLWGKDENDSHERCHWFQKEGWAR